MSVRHLAFTELPWMAGAHPLETKKQDPSSGHTLLRFEPGFSDPNWCENPHVLVGIAGALVLDLDPGSLELKPGEACTIEAGTRHRARNPGPEPVTVLALNPATLARSYS